MKNFLYKLIFPFCNKLYVGKAANDGRYGKNKPGRISLPTYPFIKESYWVTGIKKEIINSISEDLNFDHPLLHKNTLNLSEQKYNSTSIDEDINKNVV